MTQAALAVIRVTPCCPVCGDPLEPPPELEETPRPLVTQFGLTCARGHWQGLGQFWVRQRDEVH